MFFELFLFEIKYRLRRPAFYIYFFFALIWSIISYGNGWVPHQDKEMINAPASLVLYISALSMFLMMMSAFFLGVTLYRDIEHGTKEYYLSYPISKPGYFWGRFFGAFFLVALTGAAAMVGCWLGSLIGPALHWSSAGSYGPNLLIYYWQPFWTILLPNLFFTSAIFFGLVSVFRTVKVLYVSVMFFYLGYIIANFVLHNSHDPAVIFLSDPFAFNGLRMELGGWSAAQLNTRVVTFSGLLFENRLIWTGIGVLAVLLTYWRFSFQRFFSDGGARKKDLAIASSGVTGLAPGQLQIEFSGGYHRRVLLNLVKIELLNLVRDTYFWIIFSGAIIFLGFVFVNGPGEYRIGDYLRTVWFVDVFDDKLMVYIFLLILFYTGEAVHREKLTRYHLINDTLPPATWVLNCAKLISLMCLGVFLALVPVWLGCIVQVLGGAPDFNAGQYISSELVMIMPKIVELVLFSYAFHIFFDNKFLAHGLAAVIYIGTIILYQFHYIDYLLVLYAHHPGIWASDMDGIGHMAGPILWYQLYWTLAGCGLVLAGSLFFARGTRGSVGEKFKLARARFRGAARWGMVGVVVAFLLVGGFIYYNVSYLNEYLTPWEKQERSALVEKTLKRYEDLPLPRLTRLQMKVDLFPDRQAAATHAWCTVVNRGDRPIDSLLMDGDGVDYELYHNGEPMGYSCPLYFDRGKLSWFLPRREASDYRVYRLERSLVPGDSMVIEVRSSIGYKGFENGLYAAGLLRNGVMNSGNLPAMGYDSDEEMTNSDVRKEHGLGPKHWVNPGPEDPVGRRTLRNGGSADLMRLDVTVSTAGDQWAVAPGRLEREWQQAGRHYFHYVQNDPMVYMPFGIFSSRYAVKRDTVRVPNGGVVQTAVCYYSRHDKNLGHFMGAMKDGLHYYSAAFGAYPFSSLTLLETPAYGPAATSMAGIEGMSEPRGGWVADLRGHPSSDYLYYQTAEETARQWWGQQVVANHTIGSSVIDVAIPKYLSLRMLKRKAGEEGVARMHAWKRGDYRWAREMAFGDERPLLYSDRPNISASKGALVLYGMAEMMGEDSVNAALAEFLHRWSFRNGGPYPGAVDLYRVLKAHTPDSLRYYVEDSWERLCFYDNRVIETSVKHAVGDSSWVLKVGFVVSKTQIDSAGGDHAVAVMNDLVDIGVYSETSGKESLLKVVSARYAAGEHVIELRLPKRPIMVRIDPLRKLLDLRDDDNERYIGQ